MKISYQISWRQRSEHQCNNNHVTNKHLFKGEDTFKCQYGCSGNIISPISYVCTYFSAEDDWTFGENTMTYNFNHVSDENTVTIGTTHSAWISDVGGSSWNISTTFSLVTRADISKINSSPEVLPTPPLRLQQGCSYTIPLVITDPDNDTVRCRWAVGDECSSICYKFPGAILDSNTCTISYTANDGTGIRAVAIMIEDYAPGSLHHPLSSVALQFLVLIYYSSQPCSVQADHYRFPAIVAHPLNETVFSGESVNITLTCMANETASYYWERQNGDIPNTSIGVRTNTLTLFDVQREDADNYRCVAFVCSICRRSYSDFASITIINGKCFTYV